VPASAQDRGPVPVVSIASTLTRARVSVRQALIRPFGETLHHGGVSGMSASSWKPVFMTCGKWDRTVKLWNYENRSLLLSVDYPEDVADVSLHPTGLYAIVATAGRVAFCVVYADALRPARTFELAGCRLARFSNAGHAFAVAVDGGNVLAYSSITFQTLFELGAGDRCTVITFCALRPSRPSRTGDWNRFS